MIFTVHGYIQLLDLLRKNGYGITDYFDWEKHNKCVILRHDVDFDLEQAFSMAQTEHRLEISSTYFVLLTSDFYNINSCRNKSIVKEIQDMGHIVGLHFDEMAYPGDVGDVDKIVEDIKEEISILSEVVKTDVSVFSYHRPSKVILDADIRIQGVINSYGDLFFKQFKYLSDSRMHWREPVMDFIQQGIYSRMQILTHPFWYHNEEKSMKKVLSEFLNAAGVERYNNLNDNFTNLRDIIDWSDGI